MSQNKLQDMKQAKEVHKENLKKSLEHRLQVAQAEGNEKLIYQLEAEMKYIG